MVSCFPATKQIRINKLGPSVLCVIASVFILPVVVYLFWTMQQPEWKQKLSCLDANKNNWNRSLFNYSCELIMIHPYCVSAVNPCHIINYHVIIVLVLVYTFDHSNIRLHIYLYCRCVCDISTTPIHFWSQTIKMFPCSYFSTSWKYLAKMRLNEMPSKTCISWNKFSVQIDIVKYTILCKCSLNDCYNRGKTYPIEHTHFISNETVEML